MSRTSLDTLGYLNADWVLDHLVIQQHRTETDIAAMSHEQLLAVILDIGDFNDCSRHRAIAEHTAKWVQHLARKDTELHA